MQTVTVLGIIFEGNNYVNVIVFLSALVPLLLVVLVIIPVFFRAARRNDEREALEKQLGPRPPEA